MVDTNWKIAPNRHARHPFDIAHGTDTAGYIAPGSLQTGQIHDATNNGYSAVAPSVFQQACRRWRESLPVESSGMSNYTFVDVGCGKGRALLLASELGFRRVLGVELHADLARVAEHNVKRWNGLARTRSSIRVLRQDAMEMDWPRPPLLIFLNNPFACELVAQLAEMLTGIAQRGPRMIDVMYVNPGCAGELTRHDGFKIVWDEQIDMDKADQNADPYGATADRVALFRLVAHA